MFLYLVRYSYGSLQHEDCIGNTVPFPYKPNDWLFSCPWLNALSIASPVHNTLNCYTQNTELRVSEKLARP